MAWYELDPNWYGIWVMRILGLAWDVKAQKLASGIARYARKKQSRDDLAIDTGTG
jgi:fatty-acid desaturase